MVGSEFIKKIQDEGKYIIVLENLNIKKLKEMIYIYTNLLKHTHPRFTGNAEILHIDDLLQTDIAPTSYVLSIMGIEATPTKHAKFIGSIIGRRIMKEFRTVLPITSVDILEETFKGTQLIYYLQHFGVVINDLPSDV